MAESQRVGIIVPTLGTRLSWLETSLASIRSQTEAQIEIVLVAPIAEPVLALASRFGAQIVQDPGGGLSQAINAGWRELRGRIEFVTWLGDDDVLSPESISFSLSKFNSNRDLGVVFGRTRVIDSSSRTIYLARTGLWAVRYMGFGQDYVPQPGSLIRVDALDVDQIVDESLANAMDLDLFLSLRSRGVKFGYIDREQSCYRVHNQAITSRKGIADESSFVRSRYLSQRDAAFLDRARPLLRLIEKSFVWVQWHLPQSGVKKGALVPYVHFADE